MAERSNSMKLSRKNLRKRNVRVKSKKTQTRLMATMKTIQDLRTKFKKEIETLKLELKNSTRNFKRKTLQVE